ncbi:polysaccharide biosynthesis protein [Pandoraea sp. SD6-2]|uniref:lipopolysaccharide biosynthesis protein n=1 Tax=Pandoraea communis TaxID=2508297 RepID=UPI00032F15CF|nr:oligosaccharide flippase family protein [Pandoraea communis]EON11783.1 polysaccharide biosynthesis protein [Pandoraea sp. SD6-2]
MDETTVIFVLVGRLLQFAVMFLTVKVMTTILPPHELGKTALITSSVAFFAMLLINPVGMFINRRLHAWQDNKTMRGYFHAYCLYLSGVAIVAAAIIWALFHTRLVPPGTGTWWPALLVAGSILFATVNQTLVPSLNMIGRARAFVVLTLATLISGLAFSVVLVHLWSASAESWLTGVIIGQILFSVLGYVVFFSPATMQPFRGLRGVLTRERCVALFRFCWPVALAAGLNWLQMQGYRFVLAKELGLADLGLFVAGYGIAAALLAATETILTTWFQPAFYRQANDPDQHVRATAWVRYADKLLPLSILGVSALLAGAPYLTALMLGPQYQGAARFVAFGAIAEWIRILIGLFGLGAHLRMQTRSLVVPNLVGATATFGLVFLALPHVGLDGVAPSIAIGGALVVLQLYWHSRGTGFVMRPSLRPLLTVTVVAALGVAISILLRPWIDGLGGRVTPLVGTALIACLWSPVAMLMLRRSKILKES